MTDGENIQGSLSSQSEEETFSDIMRVFFLNFVND